MAAAARAQAAGGQEFAYFSSYLGVGTYPGQLAHIHLPDLDPDLNGFEGGYVRKTQNNVDFSCQKYDLSRTYSRRLIVQD